MPSAASITVAVGGLAFVAAAFLMYLAAFLKETPDTARANRVLDLGFVAVFAAILIEAHGSEFHLPVKNRYQALLFFAGSLVAVYEVAGRRLRLERFGLILAPLVLALLGGALLSRRQGATALGLADSPWFWLHAVSAFLSYAAFALSFVASVLYLMQERGLKARPPRRIYQLLPSLETLERAIAHTIGLGLPFLTLALVSGVLWLRSAYGVSWQWNEPKFISSLVVWLTYGSLASGFALRLVTGKRIAMLSFLGFVLVVFTFLGTDALRVGLHRFL